VNLVRSLSVSRLFGPLTSRFVIRGTTSCAVRLGDPQPLKGIGFLDTSARVQLYSLIPDFKQVQKQSIPSNKGKLASKKAIFSPNRLKTRLQGQSSVLIAPRLGRVTLRETLRYPTPCPFGVTTKAASSNLPATRSVIFSLLSLVKDESCVASPRTTADQYKVLTPSTRTRQRVLAICSLSSLLTRNFDR
jgi:hypothetical protein